MCFHATYLEVCKGTAPENVVCPYRFLPRMGSHLDPQAQNTTLECSKRAVAR